MPNLTTRGNVALDMEWGAKIIMTKKSKTNSSHVSNRECIAQLNSFMPKLRPADHQVDPEDVRTGYELGAIATSMAPGFSKEELEVYFDFMQALMGHGKEIVTRKENNRFSTDPQVEDLLEYIYSSNNNLNSIEMEQKNYSSIETKKCKYTVSDDVRVEKYVVDCVLRDEDGIGALVILEPIVETRNSLGRCILEFTGAEDMVPPVEGTKVSVVVESESNGETEWVSQYIFHESIMCRFQNDF